MDINFLVVLTVNDIEGITHYRMDYFPSRVDALALKRQIESEQSARISFVSCDIQTIYGKIEFPVMLRD